MMFSALSAIGMGIGALPSLSGIGSGLATRLGDSGEYLQDGFEGSQPAPRDLLPNEQKLVPAKFISPDATPVRYKWLPLKGSNSIRLVKIKLMEELSDTGSMRQQVHEVEHEIFPNGLPRQNFHCEIIHVSLEDDPVFDAVSYTWLNYKRCIPLVIDGRCVLPVNASLYACLQRLSKRTKDLVLWWDQICVDQTDAGIEEKGQQVRLMGRIFAAARETAIWLGEEDNDSRLALDILGRICSLQARDAETSEPLHVLQQRAQDIIKEGFRDQKSRTCLERNAIGKFLNRSWFKRAWIYQEAAVTSNAIVMIGSREVDFSKLSKAVQIYCEAEQEKIRSFEQSLTTATKGYGTLRVIEIGRQQRRKHGRWTNSEFVALLCRLAGTVEATDKRDMIYAFNAFQDTEKPLIGADYKLPVEEVYNRSARALIEDTRSLDIFGIIGASKILTGLASWAPDWTQHLPQGHPVCKAGHMSAFAACGTFRHSLRSAEANITLQVQGRVIDNVALVLGRDFIPNDRNKGPIDVFLKLDTTINDLQAGGSPHERLADKPALLRPAFDPSISKDEHLKKRLLRVMLADGAFSLKSNTPTSTITMNQPPRKLNDTDFSDFLKVYRSEDSIRANDRHLPNIDRLIAVRDAMRENMLICLRKHVFCGESGRLGIAPKDVKERDVVAVLHGSRCPVILRKVETGGDLGELWRLIGQCYFENWMYGDLVDWKEEDGETFKIV